MSDTALSTIRTASRFAGCRGSAFVKMRPA
jgi:hypothetical protein